MVYDILGLNDPKSDTDSNTETLDGVMKLLMDIRKQARANKDWGTSDMIRERLTALGIVVKDGKEDASWELTP